MTSFCWLKRTKTKCEWKQYSSKNHWKRHCGQSKMTFFQRKHSLPVKNFTTLGNAKNTERWFCNFLTENCFRKTKRTLSRVDNPLLSLTKNIYQCFDSLIFWCCISLGTLVCVFNVTVTIEKQPFYGSRPDWLKSKSCWIRNLCTKVHSVKSFVWSTNVASPIASHTLKKLGR